MYNSGVCVQCTRKAHYGAVAANGWKCIVCAWWRCTTAVSLDRRGLRNRRRMGGRAARWNNNVSDVVVVSTDEREREREAVFSLGVLVPSVVWCARRRGIIIITIGDGGGGTIIIIVTPEQRRSRRLSNECILYYYIFI